METTTDLIIVVGTAVVSIGAMYVVGKIEEGKREMKKRRKQAQRGANNFVRIQALKSISSGVIKGVDKN